MGAPSNAFEVKKGGLQRRGISNNVTCIENRCRHALVPRRIIAAGDEWFAPVGLLDDCHHLSERQRLFGSVLDRVSQVVKIEENRFLIRHTSLSSAGFHH